MPDGELCLLALPPECSQGEGPSSMQYLKLCSRYITNRKVSTSHFCSMRKSMEKKPTIFEELSLDYISIHRFVVLGDFQ